MTTNLSILGAGTPTLVCITMYAVATHGVLMFMDSNDGKGKSSFV